MKAGSELDQSRDFSLDLHPSLRRLGNTCHNLEQSAFARSVLTDNAKSLPLFDLKADSIQSRHYLIRPHSLKNIAFDNSTLERQKTMACRVFLVDTNHIIYIDGDHLNLLRERIPESIKDIVA